MRVYPVSYITNEMRLCIWLSKLLTMEAPIQYNQINATRKFNVDVWHLQCGNIIKINQHCTQYT